MRSIGLIAAVVLLAGCEGEGDGNEPGTNAHAVHESSTAAAPEPVPVAEGGNAAEAGDGPISACLIQGKERLEIKAIRALGTEPFWSARVDGRCVTYSTPEDQQGVRIWTRYSAAPDEGGSWEGQLGGKPFIMRTRPETGCSDGMSDKLYPFAVQLTVNGEQREGCAEPI